MTFQISQGLVDFSQIRFLALAGEVQKQGVLQFRAIETKAQGFIGFLFEQTLSNFSQRIGSGMTAHDPGSLGRDLHLFEVQGIVFSSLNLDH